MTHAITLRCPLPDVVTATFDEGSVPTGLTSTRRNVGRTEEGSSKRVVLATFGVLVPCLVSIHVTTGECVPLRPVDTKGKRQTEPIGR